MVILATAVLVSAGSQPEPARADHSGDTFNCEDFRTRQDLEEHPGEQDNLDGDNDGLACEQELPPGVR